jgi:hypothetical protein
MVVLERALFQIPGGTNSKYVTPKKRGKMSDSDVVRMPVHRYLCSSLCAIIYVE